MRTSFLLLPVLCLFTGLLAIVPALAAPQVQLLLPLGRTAYQTNEQIDLSTVLSDTQALPAGILTLLVTGDDASTLAFTFPMSAVAANNGAARTTQHFHLDGRLLRPGAYTVSVAANGATATTRFELFSHIRKSPFKLIDWGSRAAGIDLTRLGEDSLGFNLVYGEFRQGRTLGNAEASIRGGLDFMQCCTMSGAHQMDLRSECDWSDPLVVRGGTARVAQQAFLDRTTPNELGVHFYDEPGLTWATDPITGKMTPHAVPSQKISYKGAFGAEPIHFSKVTANDPDSVTQWMQWGRWKESFMDAAWKDAAWGLTYAKPDAIACTQSMYGWTAYADGYYFNVVRSLPVISGHGGYDDGPASYFYPSYHLEFGRVRDLNKPVWYLPTWYGGMSSDNYRMEQYLSFMMGLQGMAKPPDMQVHNPLATSDAEGIVESNKTMARLGTIFTTMPLPRPDVAMLYSISQDLHAQVKNMDDNYEADGHTRAKLMQVYLAGKQSHIPIFPIVEEDVLDGTLAANHKAVVLTGIDYLDPKVVSALEAYIVGGGTVFTTDDCQVKVAGTVALGVAASTKQYKLIGDLWATNQKESMVQRAAYYFIKESQPLAKALTAKCAAIGITPALPCDNPEVVISRQALGDIEYFFAVNSSYDTKANTGLSIRSTSATLTFPNDGQGMYDAVRGGAVPELAKAGAARKNVTAKISFGAGQMRVFAHTARPIGGVQVGAPTLFRDYTVAQAPYRVQFTATLVDTKGVILSGSAPLAIVVTDPLGAVRYDLYRATDHGACTLVLPLAVNDPSGKWQVTVTDLLAGTSDTATFSTTAPTQCGALAGATPRAVYFGNDRENIFRFFRAHDAVTLVVGTSDFDKAAAQRLTDTLRPWGVRCTTVDAASVNKPRHLSAEDAKTWVGLEFGRVDADSKPYKVGFAVDGPVVLLGNNQDNPLMSAVDAWGFQPYKTGADFPGPGRGMISWQIDAVGIGQESITAIAYDAAGMAEAVGTIYEAAAGLDPLTRLVLPATAAVTPATKATIFPVATVAWQVVLPDRITWMDRDGTLVRTNDGAYFKLANGKASPTEVDDKDMSLKPLTRVTEMSDVAKKVVLTNRLVKQVVTANNLTAIAYWGGALQIIAADGTLKAQQTLPQDINTLTWSGNTLVVCLADGKILGLQVK